MRTIVGVMAIACVILTLFITFSVDALANDPGTDVTLDDESVADADQSNDVNDSSETVGAAAVVDPSSEGNASGETVGAATIGDQSSEVNAAGEDIDAAHSDQLDVASGDSVLSVEKSADDDLQKRLDAEALAWEALNPPYTAPTPLPIYGQAMYYNPGVMQRVIDNRLKTARITLCTECVGYVAMLRAGDLNRKIWLQTGRTSFEGPFLVTDVAAPQHVGQLIAKNWAVDVDFRTARSWNMKMPYVTIWDRPPLDLFLERDTLPLVWDATMLPRENFIWPPRSFEASWTVAEEGLRSRAKPAGKSGVNSLNGGLVAERLDYYIR